MSLSAKGKAEINTYQVLLDILTAMAVLAEPKAIKAKISELHASTDEEEKRLAEANEIIAKAESIIRSQNQIKIGLATKERELQKKEALLSDEMTKLKKSQEEYNEKVSKLADISAESKALGVKTDNLRDAEQNHAAKLTEISQREAKVSAQESHLKDKAKQLKELAGGL